jgi:hypothetical protein
VTDLRILNGSSTRKRKRGPQSRDVPASDLHELRVIDCRPDLYDALAQSGRSAWRKSAWPIAAGALAAAACLLLIALVR